MGTKRQRFPHKMLLIRVKGLVWLWESNMMALRGQSRILLSKKIERWTPCLLYKWSWWRRWRIEQDPGS